MITPEQREARRKFIGSSDISAIMGMSAWRSAADVWLSKTGRVDDQATNDAMEAGDFLESAILDWAEREIGTTLNRGGFYIDGCRCANLDADFAGNIVEAKSSGIVGPKNPAYGDGGDDLPDDVLLQTHHQSGVTGFRHIFVPVLLGGIGFRMYEFDADPDVINATIEAAETFWRKHVMPDIPPEDFKPSIDVLKRMRRVPNKVVVIPDFLGLEFEEARQAELAAKKLKEEVEAKVLAALGDGDGIEFDGRVIPYAEVQRAGYTVAPSSYRAWKFPRAKKQKQESAPVGAA